MGTLTYIEKLRSPKWQKKRLEIFQRDSWACLECSDMENSLHVHHLQYIHGKDPWDYSDDNFQTLCEDCHKTRHNIGESEPSISQSSGVPAKENIISQLSHIVAVDLQPKIDFFFQNNKDLDEQVQFIINYNSESIRASLYDHFIAEELNSNSYLRAVQFASEIYAMDKLGKVAYHLHPDYKKIRKKYFDNHVLNYPFEKYISNNIDDAIKQLIRFALKLIAQNINTALVQLGNNLDQAEIKLMESMKLKRLSIEIEKKYKSVMS